MRPNLVCGLGVALGAALFAAGLPGIDSAGGYAGLSQRFLPAVVTIGLAVCAVLLLTRRESVLAQAEDAGTAVAPQRGAARLAMVVAALLLHMALIGVVGFVLASTLLMVLVSRGYGSRRPARDALIALAITAPMWAVFAKVLGVALPFLPLAGF